MDFDSIFNFEVSNSCCDESYDMFMGITYQGYVSNTIIQSRFLFLSPLILITDCSGKMSMVFVRKKQNREADKLWC